VADLLAHGLENLRGAARLLRAEGAGIVLRREAGGAGAVARGGDDGAGGDEEPRSGDQPLVDGPLEGDVAESGAFGA
jgi:hypothetical protein